MKRIELLRAVADYIGSEGCSCCRGDDHDVHQERLAKLLGVPKYRDGSGYDFSRFKTPNTDLISLDELRKVSSTLRRNAVKPSKKEKT